MPVTKAPDLILPAETPLADRRNLVYKGTTVLTGLGRAVVTATGNETEVGRIGALVGGVVTEPTPLERRLDRLGRRLVWLALAVAALVAGLGALQGMPLELAIETAIAWRWRRCQRPFRRSRRLRWRSASIGWRAGTRSSAVCPRSNRWDRRRSFARTRPVR